MGPENRARFGEVANALGIKPERREGFVDAVVALVETAAIKNRLYTREMRADANLLAAAKAIRAAKTAVAKLTPLQRAHLGVTITSPSYLLAKFTPEQRAALESLSEPGTSYWWLSPPTVEVQDNMPTILLDALDDALGTAISRRPGTVAGKRGKPEGAKTSWPEHNFVREFWAHARLCGGKITLSGNKKGEAGGTIVTALKLLEPVLPKPFFPRILDYPFLRDCQRALPPDPWADALSYSE